jgi:hypothetical protein
MRLSRKQAPDENGGGIRSRLLFLKKIYPNCKIEKKVTIMGTEYIIMNF